jgi:5-methylcytosine-specific restriction endonuclease McrA
MHISISDTTLIEILAVIVILIIFLQSVVLRRRRQGKAAAPRPRPKRSARRPAWRMPLPAKRAPRRGAGTRDHGLAVARKYGHQDRSPQWPAVAHAHLAHEPACRVCGHRGRGLQVHHIKPFHLYPELELDPNNLITLCELKGRDHHLLIGHFDDWESYNPQVRTDVKRYHNENASTIRANPEWLHEAAHRPQPGK